MKIIISILLYCVLMVGCIPDVPSSATCTADGFVLVPEIGNPYDPSTWRFVLDEEGAAMHCSL